MVPLLPKWTRCPVSASRSSEMSGRALGKTAALAKSLWKGAALLVSPLLPTRCLLMAQLFKNSGWIWACGALTGALCAIWGVGN